MTGLICILAQDLDQTPVLSQTDKSDCIFEHLCQSRLHKFTASTVHQEARAKLSTARLYLSKSFGVCPNSNLGILNFPLSIPSKITVSVPVWAWEQSPGQSKVT